MLEYDVVVIGGGVMGAALAWGMAGEDRRVGVLDGADLDPRASRANLGLVWVSGKGLDAPAYALWSRDAALRWPQLAALLQAETGIDVGLQQPGGFSFALSEVELERQAERLANIARHTAGGLSAYEVLDRSETRARVPAIGPAVVGATFCPHDGHVNALRLLQALHAGMAHRRVVYRARHAVDHIEPLAEGFCLHGPWGRVTTAKVVLAAGLDNARLAPMIGLQAPLVRSKGQIVVTEKCPPFFSQVAGTLRQTDEGSVLIGESEQTDTDSWAVNSDISAVLAQRAVQMFPRIGDLNVVRIWTGFRVKTSDGLPIYDQSVRHPGAFLMLGHSGVSLTAAHALQVAPQILAGQLQPELSVFATSRFQEIP